MKWLTRNSEYKKVASADDEGEWEAESRQVSTPIRFRTKLAAHFNLGFFIFNLIFLSSTLWTASQQKSATWLLRQTNSYSPLLEKFDFSFQRIKSNASLFNNPYTIYKADPSPEVDAAWDEVSKTPVLALSVEEIRRIGKDPEVTVRVPEEFGLGKDMFFGINDGQHLIHCLDQIRQFAHYDYYFQDKWGDMSNIPPMHAAHRSHCIGVLLDALKCQPSLNMVTFSWMEEQEAPYPDFNLYRQCQNQDELIEWMESVEIKREVIDKWDFPRPADAKVLPIEPELKKLQHVHGMGHNGTWP